MNKNSAVYAITLAGTAVSGKQDEMMRFIFKLIFYSFLALVILPSFVDAPSEADTGSQKTEIVEASASFSSIEALQLASSVAGDVQSICGRDPYICETGQKIAIAAFERARDGAHIVAGLIEDYREQRRTQSDQTITGSVK